MREEKRTYPGGKGGSGVLQTLINQIPPHKVWISGFTGNDAIARAIRLPKKAIFIEKNDEQLNRFMMGIIKKIGYDTALYYNSCFIRWLDGARTNFGEWVKKEYLPTGLRSSTFNLSSYAPHDIFIFLDPPYLNTKTIQPYDKKFPVELHLALLERVRSLKEKVMITGYPSALYDKLLAPELSGQIWRKITFAGITRSGERVDECAWMNYEEPDKLQDYSFIGDDYRHRQNLKRKKERFQKRIAGMKRREAFSLLDSIKPLIEEFSK